MKKLALFVTFAGTLVFASQALAAYTPTLAIRDDVTAGVVPAGRAGTPLTLQYRQPDADDPLARLTFYAPAGITTDLTPARGTTIGTVKARATFADLGGAGVDLTGTIKAVDQAGSVTVGGSAVPVAAASQQCTGAPRHGAAWVAELTASGQTLQVPIFVDPVTGPLTATASTQLVICLPPGDVPAGTPGRATLGAKLVQAGLSFVGIFSRPSGATATWRLVATPYTPGRGTANAAGTVEAQGTILYPHTLTVGRTRQTLTRAAVTFTLPGTLQAAGVTGATVVLRRGANARTLRTTAVRVGSNGTFRATFTVLRGARSTTVVAGLRASAPDRDLGTTSCQASPFAAQGVRCVSATQGGFLVDSPLRTLKVPARPKR